MRTGALDANMPEPDLLLWPDHVVLLDGVLVQAGALANGTSIVRERDVPVSYTYYYIELDGHSLVLAKNVPAENIRR